MDTCDVIYDSKAFKVKNNLLRAGQTGRYYSDCAERKPAAHAESAVDAARLWNISEEMTGLS